MMYRQFVSRSSPEGITDRDRRLPNGAAVEDVADACRSAVLAFLEGSRNGWTADDLRRWRLGPCERALVSAHLDAPVVTLPPPPPSMVDLQAEVSQARARTFQLFAMCRKHPSARFARSMVEHGAIERIHDASGAVGWAPTARAGLRLVERLSTFIIADCLSRPRDYERLTIRDRTVSFAEREDP